MWRQQRNAERKRSGLGERVCRGVAKLSSRVESCVGEDVSYKVRYIGVGSYGVASETLLNMSN